MYLAWNGEEGSYRECTEGGVEMGGRPAERAAPWGN